jgi:hypothetical protein
MRRFPRFLVPAVLSDSALSAETLDIGAPEQSPPVDTRHHYRHELSLGSELLDSLMRNAQDRAGVSCRNQVVIHGAETSGHTQNAPYGASRCSRSDWRLPRGMSRVAG